MSGILPLGILAVFRLNSAVGSGSALHWLARFLDTMLAQCFGGLLAGQRVLTRLVLCKHPAILADHAYGVCGTTTTFLLCLRRHAPVVARVGIAPELPGA